MIKIISIVVVCLLFVVVLIATLSGNSKLSGKFDDFAQRFLFKDKEDSH